MLDLAYDFDRVNTIEILLKHGAQLENYGEEEVCKNK